MVVRADWSCSVQWGLALLVAATLLLRAGTLAGNEPHKPLSLESVATRVELRLGTLNYETAEFDAAAPDAEVIEFFCRELNRSLAERQAGLQSLRMPASHSGAIGHLLCLYPESRRELERHVEQKCHSVDDESRVEGFTTVGSGMLGPAKTRDLIWRGVDDPSVEVRCAATRAAWNLALSGEFNADAAFRLVLRTIRNGERQASHLLRAQLPGDLASGVPYDWEPVTLSEPALREFLDATDDPSVGLSLCVSPRCRLDTISRTVADELMQEMARHWPKTILNHTVYQLAARVGPRDAEYWRGVWRFDMSDHSVVKRTVFAATTGAPLPELERLVEEAFVVDGLDEEVCRLVALREPKILSDLIARSPHQKRYAWHAYALSEAIRGASDETIREQRGILLDLARSGERYVALSAAARLLRAGLDVDFVEPLLKEVLQNEETHERNVGYVWGCLEAAGKLGGWQPQTVEKLLKRARLRDVCAERLACKMLRSIGTNVSGEMIDLIVRELQRLNDQSVCYRRVLALIEAGSMVPQGGRPELDEAIRSIVERDFPAEVREAAASRSR